MLNGYENIAYISVVNVMILLFINVLLNQFCVVLFLNDILIQ